MTTQLYGTLEKSSGFTGVNVPQIPYHSKKSQEQLKRFFDILTTVLSINIR